MQKITKYVSAFFTAMLIQALTAPVVFAANDWTQIATSDDGIVYSVQNGSFGVGSTNADGDVVYLVGRIYNPHSSTIQLKKWYVSIDDCAARRGEINVSDMDGTFNGNTDFVEGSGNIASSIAETVCGVFWLKVEKYKKSHEQST